MSVSHPLATDDARGAAGNDSTAASRDCADEAEARTGPAEGGAASRSTLPDRVVPAPEHLGLETRLAFRETASMLIDRMTTGGERLVIDCGGLKSVDSSGLNALILIHRRAAKRRVHVALRDLDDGLLRLLVLTKLNDLFEVQNGSAR